MAAFSATMAAMIEAGDFIESADVHGNYYGTSKAAVHSVFSQGKICILDIDVQGVQSVKKASLEPEPCYIFIQPPSMDELERRLRSRNTETEDRIQRRLVNAVNEIAFVVPPHLPLLSYPMIAPIACDDSCGNTHCLTSWHSRHPQTASYQRCSAKSETYLPPPPPPHARTHACTHAHS
jgi:hypothetical protein